MVFLRLRSLATTWWQTGPLFAPPVTHRPGQARPGPGGAPAFLHAHGASAKHWRRTRLMLALGSVLLMLIASGWAVFFSLKGLWAIVALDLAMVATGAASLGMSRRGNLRNASLLLLGNLFVAVGAICVFLDVPSAQVPRATHHFYLSLGACAYLLFRGERALLRHGVALLFFVAFVVFASGEMAIVTPYALPDEVRAGGTWVNNILAALTLYLVLHVMQADVAARNALEDELRAAIDAQQLVLHYQPQIGSDGQVIGAEALVRWQHPQRGMVPPGEFIPLAEQTGLIVPLGAWVMREACAQLMRWSSDPRTAALTLAVNVSAQQFRLPDAVARVGAVLDHHGIDPTRLKIELTESMLHSDVEDTIDKMKALKALGVGFSLDDFGTGYSSLAYLKRLPLDQLKIDQSFVRDVLTDPNDAAIARTVVSLGQTLGLSVIAEGVETEGQRAFLAGIGCHAYQGYLFSRPLPIEAFDAFMRRPGESAPPARSGERPGA